MDVADTGGEGIQASRSNLGRLQKTEVGMANRNRKKTASAEVVESVEKELYENVRAYISAARAKVYTVANAEMVKAYWNVGREIVEKQGGADRAKYGNGLIRSLSVKLTAEFGPGYTGTNLRYMRLVYLAFPNCHTLCDKLSWSHYRLLASVDKIEARDFYLSELVKHLSKFMLELGRGFALVREQCPIQIGDETYHCDLLFYNFIARCFVLIDLKVGKVTPQDIGQMQLYKHYYEREMMNPGDNPPIGIVLGSDRDEAVIRYTLNEHERNLFAVKYHLNLPTVEELQMELMRERAAIEEAMAIRALPPPEPEKKSAPRKTLKGGRR